MQFKPAKLPRLMLWEAVRDCGKPERSSPRIDPKAILVDFQRPNLRFEGRPWYPQLDRSPCGSRHPATGIFQYRLDHVLLFPEESLRELNLLFRFRCH